MITCPKNDSIVVTGCDLVTPAQWLAGTTSCRLRIKNFNAADWISGGCGTCTGAGGSTWDGTFPLITHLGGQIQYAIDPTTGNVGGKTPLFGTNCAVGTIAGTWYLALACNGAPAQFIWSSDFHPTAGGPLVIYNRNQGCVLSPSFQIEAYSL